MKKKLTGDDLIGLGYEPSKLFGEMLKIANEIYESQDDIPEVLVALDEFVERNTPAEVETLPLQHSSFVISTDFVLLTLIWIGFPK